MQVTGVDPRDITWEADATAYRVYFWHQPGRAVDDRREDEMYWCDEQRITGAVDVHEVIARADRTALPEQTYTLYVEHHHEHGPGTAELGMIQLAGTDPTLPGMETTIGAIG